MADPLVIPGDMDEHGVVHLDMPRAAVQAICRKRWAGQRVDVEIRSRKSKRSDLQNKALHAAWKGWADFLGYDVDELKREMLAKVFGTVDMKSPLTGAVVVVPVEPHTSTLNTAQFAELMESAVQVAAETGYLLELPDEWKARKAKAARRRVA
jgi:hypothetical protein